MPDSRKRKHRRQFLKAAASAGLSVPLCLMPGMACGDTGRAGGGSPDSQGPEGGGRRRSEQSGPPTVVTARDDAMRTGQGRLDREQVRKMLDESVRRLTGARSPREGWQSLFSQGERVTIKVGCLPGAHLSTRPEVAFAVARGAVEAGVSPSDIIIWDRSDRELRRAGYEIEAGGRSINCYGTDHLPGGGYTSTIYTAGQVGSLFSKILTERTDALVSVAVLKDHDLSGVSLSMKNFFGVIHNPNKYHEDNCDPYIAQLMTHRLIGGRLRLAVIDGSLAQAHRGPAYNPRYAWEWNGLLVSADPVAADAVGAGIIEKRRKELDLPSLKQAGRPPGHIQTAQSLEVGTADLDRIRRIEI